MIRYAVALGVTVAGVGAVRAQELPHRSIEVERTTAAPMGEVQACMARWGKAFGKPLERAIERGVAYDLKPGILMGGGDPYLTIEVRDRGEVRAVTMLYRHPHSAAGTKAFFKQAAKKCQLGDEVPTSPPAP